MPEYLGLRMTEIPSTGSVPSIPLTNPGRQRDWTVPGAIVFAIFVVVTAQLAGLVLLQLMAGGRSISGVPARAFIISQLVVQGLQLGLAWFLAGSSTPERMRSLNLLTVHLSVGRWAGYVALLFVAKTIATALAAGIVPVNTREELAPFKPLLNNLDVKLAFLAIIVVAGLTEELVFRGVLSRTLEATRLGFWLGAAIASGSFAVIHLQYGIGGQLVVFAIGMTLAWIRMHSGSLWPAVVCHSLNNAIALIALEAAT